MPSRSNSWWLSSRSNRAREEIATISGGGWESRDMGRSMRERNRTGRDAARDSGHELLADDALFQVVLRIKQQRHLAAAGFANPDFEHVAHFVQFRGDAYWSIVMI